MRKDSKQMIFNENADIRFVANVIINWHTNPAKKLRGLAKLIAAGSVVRTGHFAIDILVVDGCQMAWESLETM
jgi:hypothetical protein